LKRILFNAALGILLAFALVYVGDSVSLAYRIPRHREQFGSVMVRRAYIIPMKNGKNEYAFDPPASQECVNALFPHYGDPPCWYLRRHTRQQINTGSQ